MIDQRHKLRACSTRAEIRRARSLQGPEEVFAMAVLLGDLFPAEWPAPGRARAMGKPHPPPPGMGVQHRP